MKEANVTYAHEEEWEKGGPALLRDVLAPDELPP